jgi:hypothetical protein
MNFLLPSSLSSEMRTKRSAFKNSPSDVQLGVCRPKQFRAALYTTEDSDVGSATTNSDLINSALMSWVRPFISYVSLVHRHPSKAWASRQDPRPGGNPSARGVATSGCIPTSTLNCGKNGRWQRLSGRRSAVSAPLPSRSRLYPCKRRRQTKITDVKDYRSEH